MDDSDKTAALFEALVEFRHLVGNQEVQRRWSQPSAVEGFSVGALVFHAVNGVGRILTMLDTAADSDRDAISAADFIAMAGAVGDDSGSGHRWDDADPELRRAAELRAMLAAAAAPVQDQVKLIAEQSAEGGWQSAVAELSDIEAQLRERLAGEDLGRLLDMGPFLPVVIELGEYLVTRVIELVVHGDDLAASIGVELSAAGSLATSVVISTMVDGARRVHGDRGVVRALARQERAPARVFPIL